MFLLGTSLFSWILPRSGFHMMLPVAPSPCSPPQARARMQLLWEGASCWHCLMKCAMARGGSLASLGLWQVFMALSAPFTCPVSGAGHGFVVWNTFLIKPGDEQGTQVVHATSGHGAGTGLHHHQFLFGLTLANPSSPVTLVSAPLGHPVSHGSPSVPLASEWPL